MARHNYAAIATEFVRAARSAGWRIMTRDNSIVSISKRFTRESHDPERSRQEFAALDGEYYAILAPLQTSRGSMWGTDGAGVGGYWAMNHGYFLMQVSVGASMMDAIYAALEAAAEEEVA